MKILVVDDQASNRSLLSFLLEDDGHQVFEACDGEDSIRKFERTQPDLVLMDVMMPGMDGYEAAEGIKSRSQQHVPIIFLTALSDDVSLSRCIESGGDDFLTKPVNEVLLSAKIKAHDRIRELNNELNDKNKKLEAFQKVIKQENDLAEYVYDTAIAQNLACENISSYLSPMGGFSGDVIFAERSQRNSLYIMLGDFTGHGLPAALGALPISQQFKYMAHQGIALGDIAERLNLTLYDFLPGHMFCAANLIELSADGRSIKFWAGGLPDIFIVNNKGLIRETITSQHVALGILGKNEFKREVREISFAPNERLITYSDGVTDCCDINGVMLGEAGFEEMFDGQHSGNELFDSLVARIKVFGQGRPQDDDISILELVADTSGKDKNEIIPIVFDPMPWRFSSVVDMSGQSDGDPLVDVMKLFTSRTWLWDSKDRIYTVILAQIVYLLDNFILALDQEQLALAPENKAREFARKTAQRKILDATGDDRGRLDIHIDVSYKPAEPVIRVAVSDQEIHPDLSFVEFDCQDINGEMLSYLGKNEQAHCIMSLIPVR